MRDRRNQAGGASPTNSPRRAGSRGRPAFTLLEILIVLSLLVALLTLAWPMMESRLVGSELPESADRVRSVLSMARAAAVTENRRVRVRFEPQEQQPLVEIEPEPIVQPGQYAPIAQNLADDPPLLAEVQVHEVILGRPEFLKPISANTDATTSPKEAGNGPSGESVADTGESEITNLATTPQDAKADPKRPTIVFESDGSSDWAMLIVARWPLGEPVSDAVAQKWIILDGRTGIASVRDGLSQEELSDPALYVSREKLELPEENDVSENGLGQGDGMGQASTSGMPLSAEGGLDPLAEAMGAGATKLGGDQIPTGQIQPPPEMGQPPAAPPQDPAMSPPEAAPPSPEGQPPAAAGDSAGELEEKLKDSGLSEEEKDKIRKAFAQQGGKK